jgi:predicted RNase H-like HicB family nuclease
MTSRISLTAVYEPVEGGWTQARIKELPGVITAAPSLEEAKELLTDALREYLLSLVEAPTPQPANGATRQERQESLEVVISLTVPAHTGPAPAAV